MLQLKTILRKVSLQHLLDLFAVLCRTECVGGEENESDVCFSGIFAADIEQREIESFELLFDTVGDAPSALERLNMRQIQVEQAVADNHKGIMP